LSEHPTSAELEAFAAGGLPAGRSRQVARHLLVMCASCNAKLAAHHQRLTTPPATEVYDAVLDRAFSWARDYKRHLRREELRGRKVAALLQAGGLEALLAADLPFRDSGMLQALLERSWAVRHEDPPEMVSLARHAVEVARRLDPRYHTPQERADLQARAWGELANALRALDDLNEAERTFGIAFEFLVHGTGDLRVTARLHDLQGSYFGTRRQFVLAFAALDIAYTAYLELNDPHLAGRALLTKAIYLHYSGRPELSIEINERGLELLDVNREPNLRFFAIHNQLQFLVACGRFREARRELFQRRAELGNITGTLNALKLRALQGLISAGLHEWSSAEAAFTQVKVGFEEAGMGLHGAVASLDLALILMQQGRYEETAAMVADAVDLFVALGIQREALGAVLVLREAFERRVATLGLLEDVVEFLRHCQIDPNARFNPRGE
jgi:tetratricopeptide (TPR) repeat protein